MSIEILREGTRVEITRKWSNGYSTALGTFKRFVKHPVGWRREQMAWVRFDNNTTDVQVEACRLIIKH